MWAAFWDAMDEVGGRRIVIALYLLAIGAGSLSSLMFTFQVVNRVPVIFQGTTNLGPWAFSVPMVLSQTMQGTGTAWMLVMIFAGCPQFVSMLEKGWRELTFSKGTRRWQILAGRYLSHTTLYLAMLVLGITPLAVRLWQHTGISLWQLAGASLIQTLSFASLLASGALASLFWEGVAIPIVLPIGLLVVSPLLFNRTGPLYTLIKFEPARRAIDWLYYVLPKCTELDNAARTYLQSSTVPTSWPLWTTALFTAVTLTFTLWKLERKSF